MVFNQKFSQVMFLVLIMFVFVSVPSIAYCQDAIVLSESGGGHWSYRANIILTESIGLARNNEPVELTFKSDKVKPHGEDIRITDKDGSELPCQVNVTGNGTYEVSFFAQCASNSSNTYYLYFGNPSAGMPKYKALNSIVDNQNKTWQTNGVFIGWGGMAGFNIPGTNVITTLKFDNNGDNNPANDPDCLNDSFVWAPFYGYLDSNCTGYPQGFGSDQAQIVRNGPIFSEIAIGSAKLRYFRGQNWIAVNQYVDSMLGFDRNYQFLKHGLGGEIFIPDYGSGDIRQWLLGYDSTSVNPQYLAFRNPINGLIFGGIATDVAHWSLYAKCSGAWDRIISFDDSSNLPNAKIYWYADTSNGYDGIERFSKQVLNPLKVELQVDTESPSTNLSASPEKPNGANGWYITQPQITLSANENVTTYYTIDNNNNLLAYSNPFTIPEGEHKISYYSIDEFGNAEATKTADFKIDLSLPAQPQLTSPTGNQLTNNPTLTFSWNPATDSGSGLSHYDLYIDGSIAIPNIDSSTNNITSPKLNDGYHTWFVRAYDKAGNYSDSATSSFLIDTTAPTTSACISPASPNGENGWYVSPPSINLSASETSTIYFKLDSCDYMQYDSTITVPEGEHKICYYSIDQAGNREEEKFLEFRVDCSPPDLETVLLPQRSEGHYQLGEDIIFSYNATDLISGVESVTATVNDFPVLNGGKLSFNKPGEYALIVTAIDFAGNKIVKTLNFTVGYNFKWLPPIQKRHGLKEFPYQVKYNSTLPIKFSVYDYSAKFISDTSVKVIISDGVNSQIFDYGAGKGFVKINPTDENYLLNLRFKDCPLIKPGGCYTVSVYFGGHDSLPGTLAGEIKLFVIADDKDDK